MKDRRKRMKLSIDMYAVNLGLVLVFWCTFNRDIGMFCTLSPSAGSPTDIVNILEKFGF